jgi:cation diffusion facilitator family transporter
MTYFAIRISGKPADERHPYGHGKVEAVAALIETGLLFVVAAYVAVAAGGRLYRGETELEQSWVAYAVLGVSIVVDLVRSQSLLRIAKATNSEALAADALHFGSDLISSTLVLAGLFAALYGYPQGDTIAAIGVAVFIGIAGYRLGRRTIDTLMDAVPENMPEKIRAITDRQIGVVSVDAVRARRVGATIFADLEISVARTLPLDRVNDIKGAVTAAITKGIGPAEITVVATPRALDDETVLERVVHVATVMERHVHHVTVQHIGERLSVSLDLEVDGRLSLKAGHAIATELEKAITTELGEDIEVETHLEPLCILAYSGVDVPPEQLEQIRAALSEEAAKTVVVAQIYNVRARETAEGLVVNFHCGMDPELSIAAVHEHVDTVERAVRLAFPNIIRVIGHAEPAK